MPIKLRVDDQIKSPTDTYTVEQILAQGAFAQTCRAHSSLREGAVLLKRYFSPTTSLAWYPAFVDHQQNLKQVVMTTPQLRTHTCEFLEFFETTEGGAHKCYHQVFEFLATAAPLTDFIVDRCTSGERGEWGRRLHIAGAMMNAIATLHSRRIVHADLKPDNIFLIPNSAAVHDYQLKIIGMDFAIFSDRKAPWDGEMGYVGTPMYQSPEHMRGEVPTEGSDVFTCALILGELLGGGHPFANSESYDADIMTGRFRPFALASSDPILARRANLETLVNAALDPEIHKRPKSEDLRDALLGPQGNNT